MVRTCFSIVIRTSEKQPAMGGWAIYSVKRIVVCLYLGCQFTRLPRQGGVAAFHDKQSRR